MNVWLKEKYRYQFIFNLFQMNSDIDWTDWSDADLNEISEKIEQEITNPETSTPTDNSTGQQDLFISTTVSATTPTSTDNNTICNNIRASKPIDGGSDKSSNESDPEDSIPLINVTKKERRLQKQALKDTSKKGKEVKRLSTVSRSRHLENKKLRAKDDLDDSIPLINVTKNKKLLQKQYLKTLSKKLKKGAVKMLSTGSTILRSKSRHLKTKKYGIEEKSQTHLHTTKHYSFRERNRNVKQWLEYTDLTDDSGEDDNYKPSKEDIYFL